MIKGVTMELNEKVLSEKRKNNMKLYSVHRMLTADLLFYYAVEYIFLTQVKGLTAGEIVLANAFWGAFQFILQIPTTVLIEKLGDRKSIIISNIASALEVIIILFCNNFGILLLSYFLSAFSCAIGDVSGNRILNQSIPTTEAHKSNIFANIEGKGLGNFYFISAISGMCSGFLYSINPYIPFIICIIISLVGARVASLYDDIKYEKRNIEENMSRKYTEYFHDLKVAFSFIFSSKRLKSLMLYSGFMFSIIMVMKNYEMGLLEEINISATSIGMIYAIMQIIAGLASKRHNKVHKKFKNKTLTIIGISYTTACLVAGIVAVTNMSFTLMILIILATYAVRYMGKGLYNVLIKKYITNFTDVKMANDIYSANCVVTGLGNALVCIIGSLIVSNHNLKYSMIIFGAISIIVMIGILIFMKTRVGLKPEEYKKEDIDYKEFLGIK